MEHTIQPRLDTQASVFTTSEDITRDHAYTQRVVEIIKLFVCIYVITLYSSCLT